MARSRRKLVANPTKPRLQYVEKNFSPSVFITVVIALFNAMGHDAHAAGLDNEWSERDVPPDWAASRHDAAEDRRAALVKENEILSLVAFEFLHDIEEEDGSSSTPYDQYLPWLATQLSRTYKPLLKQAKKTEVWRSDATDIRFELQWLDTSNAPQFNQLWGELDEAMFLRLELEQRFGSIAEWANATGIDINKVSAQDALDQSNAWGLLQPKGDIVPGTVVYTFDDGWTFQELTTRPQLECEGRKDVLFHCVKSYKVRDIGVKYRIFSLRDPDGWPHATMEWKLPDEYVVQFKGYDNKVPEKDEVERAIEFRLKYIDENLVSPENKLEQIVHYSEAFPTLAGEFKGEFKGAFMPPGRYDLAFATYEGGHREAAVSVWAINEFVNDAEQFAANKFGAGDSEAVDEYVLDQVRKTEPGNIPGSDLPENDFSNALMWGLWKKTGEILASNDELLDQLGYYDLQPPDGAADNPRKRRKAKRKKTPEYKKLLDRSHRLWETYDAKPLKKHLVAFGTHVERMKKSDSLKVKTEARRAARAFNAEFRARGWKK